MNQGAPTSASLQTMIAPAFPEKWADHRTWGQLHGSSDALAICESARAHKGLTLVITRSTAEAIRLEQSMRSPGIAGGGRWSHRDRMRPRAIVTARLGNPPLPIVFSAPPDITSRRIRFASATQYSAWRNCGAGPHANAPAASS